MFAFLLNLALGVRLGFYKISDILEKETLWKKYDPIYLAKNMDSRFRGPVFLSANQSDHYGFPEGTHFLLENLKERRFPVEFHLRPGDHCTDLAVPDLANFLASPTSVMGSAVPGTKGTLNLAAACLAASLLPMTSMAWGGGPMKVSPAFSTSWANSSFSDRNP
jgi:hypothetical protein